MKRVRVPCGRQRRADVLTFTTSDAPTKAVAKKRRIVDSEDEADIPPPKAKSRAKTKPSDDSDKKRPASSKLKPPPTKKSRTSSAEPDGTTDAASSQAAESEPGEDEHEEHDPNDEGESELEEDEEEEVAAVAAKLAKHSLPDVELKTATWKEGDPIPYAALAHVFSLVEATTKRLEITAFLTAFFLLVIKRRKAGDAESLKQAVYLCINRVSEHDFSVD